MIPEHIFNHILSTILQLPSRPILCPFPMMKPSNSRSIQWTEKLYRFKNIMTNKNFFKSVAHYKLVQQFRCTDPKLQSFFDHMRKWTNYLGIAGPHPGSSDLRWVTFRQPYLGNLVFTSHWHSADCHQKCFQPNKFSSCRKIFQRWMGPSDRKLWLWLPTYPFAQRNEGRNHTKQR